MDFIVVYEPRRNTELSHPEPTHHREPMASPADVRREPMTALSFSSPAPAPSRYEVSILFEEFHCFAEKFEAPTGTINSTNLISLSNELLTSEPTETYDYFRLQQYFPDLSDFIPPPGTNAYVIETPVCTFPFDPDLSEN